MGVVTWIFFLGGGNRKGWGTGGVSRRQKTKKINCQIILNEGGGVEGHNNIIGIRQILLLHNQNPPTTPSPST